MTFTAKTDWANGQQLGATDLLRIENGIAGKADKSPTRFDMRDYSLTSAGLKSAISSALPAIRTAGGGVVYIPGGTYLYDGWTETEAAALTSTDRVTFVGDGRATILRLNPTATGNPVMLPLVGTKVGAQDLTFDTNSVPNATCIRLYGGTSMARVSGCVFDAPGTGGVYIMPGTVTDVTITGNHFNGARYGVLTQDSCVVDGLTITGNTFRGGGVGTYGDAIEINSPTGRATSVAVVGNVISGFLRTGASSGLGIGLAHVTGATVTGNTVHDCGLNGIHVEDASHAVVVTGNVVRNCGYDGINVVTSTGVSGESPQTGQVNVSDNVVTGCGVDGGGAGIELNGGTLSPLSKDHVVSGNIVAGCGRPSPAGPSDYSGIRVGYGTTRAIVSSNIVSNTIGGTISAGITVDASTDVTLIGNRCTDDQATKTQQYGLRLSGAANVKIGLNDLTGNALADTSNPSGTLTNLLPTSVPTGTHDLAVGVSNIPRWVTSSNAITITSATPRFVSLVPPATVSVTKIRVQTGLTPAAATPSVVQFGIYTISSTGAATQIAVTANDTTLLAAANTVYEAPLTSGVTLTAGVRYAIAILVVTAAATPTFQGVIASADVQSLPRVSATATGSTLATSYTAASFFGSGQTPYAAAI